LLGSDHFYFQVPQKVLDRHQHIVVSILESAAMATTLQTFVELEHIMDDVVC
jgi:hypothetical protein